MKWILLIVNFLICIYLSELKGRVRVARQVNLDYGEVEDSEYYDLLDRNSVRYDRSIKETFLMSPRGFFGGIRKRRSRRRYRRRFRRTSTEPTTPTEPQSFDTTDWFEDPNTEFLGDPLFSIEKSKYNKTLAESSFLTTQTLARTSEISSLIDNSRVSRTTPSLQDTIDQSESEETETTKPASYEIKFQKKLSFVTPLKTKPLSFSYSKIIGVS